MSVKTVYTCDGCGKATFEVPDDMAKKCLVNGFGWMKAVTFEGRKVYCNICRIKMLKALEKVGA